MDYYPTMNRDSKFRKEFAEPGKVRQDIEYLADGAIATFRGMPRAPKAWRQLAGK